VVKFANTASSLSVLGTLSAQGSTSSKIYFTSIKDDVRNDTNNNGSANVPAPGDWQYLVVAAGATATLDHTIIRYGGSQSTSAMLYGQGGVINLSNSEVASSSYNGIINTDNGTGLGSIITITFTDIHHNSTYGIYHLAGTTSIDRSTIRNHASYGIHAANGSGNLYLTKSTVMSNNAGVALIDLSRNLNFIHSGNVASGGGKGGVVIFGAPGKAQTWYGDPYLPYIVSTTTGSVGIYTFKVTVNPGAVFKFEGASAGITVGSAGNLYAVGLGTTTGKIYFTSIKDDKVGGDTNGNGTANVPAAGDWDGIKISSGASSTLNYVVVRYGGNNGGGGSTKSIWNNGGVLSVYNTEVASSTSYGIFTDSGTTVIRAADIHANNYGACVTGGTFSIGSSAIYNNTSYGVCNTTFSYIHAENNYWGTSTGPYNAASNPTGGGNPVSNFVLISPWLTQMHYLLVSNTGVVISSVSRPLFNEYIYWNWASSTAQTKYKDAWYFAMNTWNTHGALVGGVTVATATSPALTIADINSPSAAWSAQYDPNPSPDTIQFNSYQLDQMSTSSKRWTAIHELGHAHGLEHSYWGNVMNSYVTEQTDLGTQDILDYDYCWSADNCPVN